METIIFTKKNVNTSQKEGFNLQYNVSNGTAAATSPAKLNIYYPSNPRYVITYPWYKSYRRCYHHKIKRCYLEMNYLIGSTSTQNEYIDILLFFCGNPYSYLFMKWKNIWFQVLSCRHKKDLKNTWQWNLIPASKLVRVPDTYISVWY